MMHALVTGGGGFLGLYIVEQLRAAGHTVRVLCRGRYQRLDELGVETVRGDVREAATVDSACQGVDTVFHTAAVTGIWGPRTYFFGINTEGTRNVIAACQKNGVSRLIHTSSPSVIYDGHEHRNANESLPYPKTFLCHYPHSKCVAEQAVLAVHGQQGLATIALRPHLIWGPRDTQLIPRLIARAKSGRLRRVGDGENLISMSHVENAAAAHLQAANGLDLSAARGGKAYFINEPEPVKLWGWIDELLARAGLPPVQKQISAGAAKVLGAMFEAIYGVCGIRSEPPMTRFLAQQLSGSHYYDVSRARHDFGYTPIVSVEEGLQKYTPELQALAIR